MAKDARSNLIDLIQKNGPISIADYLSYCLNDPAYGYYTNRNPLGRDGDFVTSPEISQIFGELLGLWILDKWLAMRTPKPIALIELGPGRGILMQDVLRSCELRPGFIQHVTIHLLEINKVLIKEQTKSLKGYPVVWHKTIEDLLDATKGHVSFFVANEFFDALPSHQYVCKNKTWYERLIDYKEADDTFVYTRSLIPQIPPTHYPLGHDGAIIETSPEMTALFRQITQHIDQNRGGLLLVDYGYNEFSFGDTLQAVQGHDFVDVFADIGNMDLTTHVNYAPFMDVLQDFPRLQHTYSTQREFLIACGIYLRAHHLASNQPEEIQKQILLSVTRLISPEEMGDLFKVLAVIAI